MPVLPSQSLLLLLFLRQTDLTISSTFRIHLSKWSNQICECLSSQAQLNLRPAAWAPYPFGYRHSSNTFMAHLLLCSVFLGTVLSKRRRSSSVSGGRNRRAPLSSSMSTFAIQMYHCKRLRQFKEIIARK